VLIDGFPAGPPGTNCYVVAPAPGEQCIVIDPGIGAENTLEEILREHRLQPVAVLLTHGHIDHTFSVLPVCNAKNIPAYIHPDDRPQLSDPWTWVGARKDTPLYGRLEWTEPDDVKQLADGETISLAGMDLRVDLAPGHTPGSVTFATPGPVGLGGDLDAPVLFSGDLLFQGSIGRTDLPGGSYEQILQSLGRVILPLPDETLVLSGHGPATTVGRERMTNPFLMEVTPSGGPRTGM
jgi:glyoxylase-like metal-dependent hydrolase (beta-lactamase superfamily II)